MIPGSFDYHRPSSVKEAVGLLAQLGEDARAIAGGHSLIPMMKLRLASPSHLVDLGGVAELKGIREEGGDVVIGATTTQHELIGSDALAKKLPILREVALQIADPQVRYVGTARRQCRQRRSRQRHAGGHDVPGRDLSRGRQVGRAQDRRARFLSGRLFHRAGAGRDRHRGAHPGAGRRPRLRLREAQAQDRRLRHRRRRRGADHEGRQGRELLDRPHQRGRDAAVGGRGRQDPDRLVARRRDREESGGRRRGDHLARH